MAFHRVRAVVIALLAAANLAALAFLAFAWYPRWRQTIIVRAMTASEPPAFWWPPSWRRDLQTRFLLEATARVKDPSAPLLIFAVELESEVDGRSFRATASPSIKMGFSFGDQLLPVGPFRIRGLARDGRCTRWIRIPEIDPGRHRMDFQFTLEEPIPGPPPGDVITP